MEHVEICLNDTQKEAWSQPNTSLEPNERQGGDILPLEGGKNTGRDLKL